MISGRGVNARRCVWIMHNQDVGWMLGTPGNERRIQDRRFCDRRKRLTKADNPDK
mgnify:CR=1 FL=1